MIINLPHFLVVGVVVKLEPLVPELTSTLNVRSHSRVNLKAPLPLNRSSILRIDGSGDLDRLAHLGL